MSDQSTQDCSDAVVLWRSLRDYLTLDVEVDDAESPGANSDVMVRLTVANTAPSGPDWPEIVFEDLSLYIGGSGSGGSSRQISREFSSGQSLTYEHRCTFRELAALKFHVEGNVSRRRFFHIQQTTEVPIIHTKPTILAYIRAFNDLALHNVLDSTQKSISMPSPQTTFAELQTLTATLSSALSDIEETRCELKALASIGAGERVGLHFRNASEYLTQIQTVFTRLKEALSSASSEEISAALGAMDALESEAAQVNRSTEELMHSYDISVEEAHYSYRGR